MAIVSLQILLVIAAIAVVLWALIHLRLVVVPLLISLLLAALLHPIADAAIRHGLPRMAGAWLALLTALGSAVLLLTFVTRSIVDQWPQLVTEAGKSIQEIQNWLTTGPLKLDAQRLETGRQSLVKAVEGNREQLTTGAITGATLALEIVVGLFLCLIVLFFFLKDGERIWRWLVGFAPDSRHARLQHAGRRAFETLGHYARGTVVVAAVDAIFIGLGLVVFRVPLALPLTLLVFLGAFIPLIGATITGTLAALVALVTVGPVGALGVAIVVIATFQLEGHVVSPLILGRALSLHPLAVLLVLAAGTLIAGIIGALLSVPIAAVVWVVFKAMREELETPPSDGEHTPAEDETAVVPATS